MRSTFRTGLPTLSGNTLSRLVSVACSVAFVLFGYEQGVMGGLITGAAFTKQFPTIDTTTANGNASLQGFVVAVYNIGCWLGSLLTMFIGEPLGRKPTIIVGALVLAVGSAIQCSAFGLPQLIVGRVITGTGNGIITSTIPVWHAELVRANSRGSFITTELSTNVVSNSTGSRCPIRDTDYSGWSGCRVLGGLRMQLHRQPSSVETSHRSTNLPGVMYHRLRMFSPRNASLASSA